MFIKDGRILDFENITSENEEGGRNMGSSLFIEKSIVVSNSAHPQAFRVLVVVGL